MASLPIFTPATITQTVGNNKNMGYHCPRPRSLYPDPHFPDFSRPPPQSQLATRNRGSRQNNRWQKYLHALWVHLSESPCWGCSCSSALLCRVCCHRRRRIKYATPMTASRLTFGSEGTGLETHSSFKLELKFCRQFAAKFVKKPETWPAEKLWLPQLLGGTKGIQRSAKVWPTRNSSKGNCCSWTFGKSTASNAVSSTPPTHGKVFK